MLRLLEQRLRVDLEHFRCIRRHRQGPTRQHSMWDVLSGVRGLLDEKCYNYSVAGVRGYSLDIVGSGRQDHILDHLPPNGPIDTLVL